MTEIEVRLYEYSDIKRRIREMELQLDELEAKKAGVYDKLLGVNSPKEVKTLGGPLYDPITEAVAKLVDVYAERIRRIACDLAEANAKLAAIEKLVAIAGLTEIEMRYVRLRYFECVPAWKVAQKLGYSESRALDYKRSAIKKIAENRGFFLL